MVEKDKPLQISPGIYNEDMFKEWVNEMAAHVKSIDNYHLLQIGLEGFYGDSKKASNPGSYLFGTDFISNNQIPQIDFATIHLYPEQWLQNSSEDEQASFVDRWIQAHVQDSSSVLRKPLVIGEFGKSSKLPGNSLQKRDTYFVKIYSDIYDSVRRGGPFTGGLFWQLMAEGMESWVTATRLSWRSLPQLPISLIYSLQACNGEEQQGAREGY
ncbi:hypothetical protein NC653_004909 [Populus alba x Populus x berolinensis]|uniref:mannan endo-1,4-beta-mannosidase n=1 Tax=Populus alba x Populus x berolinensis TaxID=444605 RepID=A0AAD6WAM7_9ROSI|nr:hypothetical protein NC653_004909 [Populus alba x Populus x berolinensis]